MKKFISTAFKRMFCLHLNTKVVYVNLIDAWRIEHCKSCGKKITRR